MTAVAEPVRIERDIPDVGLLEFIETHEQRAYWLTAPGAKRRTRLPSVTTILKGTWPRSAALQAWIDRQADGGAERKSDGAERGKAVHDYIERSLRTGVPAPVEHYPAEYHGYLTGAAGFLWDFDPWPAPDGVERLVCHPERRYAGRLDLIADLADRRGASTLLDFKSNPKGAIYPEAHAQTTAYVEADERCGAPRVERVLLVGISEDGEYNVVEGIDASAVWLATLEFQAALRRHEKAVEG